MKAAVVGCGTAGPAAALWLARQGHEVRVLERSPELLPVGAGLLLQPLGLCALARLGVLPEVLEHAADRCGVVGVEQFGHRQLVPHDILVQVPERARDLGEGDRAPAVVSEAWPPWAREALRQFKLPAAQRSAGAPLLSMPAAELFATWAVAEAAASAKPFTAVIAVGDCDPAADALDAASSATPQMSALLARARQSAKQWLGVSVPREWNLDADRLSHPAELPEGDHA